MRVLIGDIIYNVNRIIRPDDKGSSLLVYVVGLDSLITCYFVECWSEYYAETIFHEILTNGYSNLNTTYKVKKITYKG